ncbi:MAG: T9SS type A sorting domain-containing protein, partial [Ignavibacteria bacterium]|nr:T9SS type A sorting domain-containing protein [Ignavibacteria bacterium]
IFGVSFFNANYGFAVDQNDLLKSTNGGVNWEYGGFTPTGGPSGIKVFNVNSGIGWICTRSTSSPGKIYRTSNGGVNWTEQTTTLASGKSFTCISMNSVNNGWAGTGGVTVEMRIANKRMITDRGLLSNGGIYKYSDNITTFGNENTYIPHDYELKQNYPNPFNPETKIEYSVPANVLVTIKVFDVTGREVSVLLNEFKNAGSYSVSFNGNNLPSGIYFLKMRAGGFEQTRVMNLVK